MTITGYVIGDRANKYPSHSYRVPILEELTVHSIDPNRINFMNEFPRDTAMYPSARTETRLNIKIVFNSPDPNDNNLELIELWLIPNKYTESKEKQVAVSFKAINTNLHYKRCEEEIMKLAFN